MADEASKQPAQEAPPPAGDGHGKGGDPTSDQMIPYARFKEVNDARKELEARLAKIEEQQKAQAEKELAEQNRWKELAEKREQELAAERLGRLRLETAAKHGLPVEFAGRLQGSTVEELAQDAQSLAAFLKPAAPGNLPRANGQPETAPTEAQLSDPKWVRENAQKLWPIK